MPDPDHAMNFFVSHADTDLEWAEWIAAELEGAGYGVIVKAWDFRPGENTLSRHDEALATCRHTICVLSEDYVNSEVAARTAAHYQGLQGKERALIPVQVAACEVPPLLGPIVSIDLSGLEEPDEARRRLLDGVAGRVDRVARAGFPGARAAKVRFPGAPPDAWELRGHRADPHFVGRDDTLAELHRALRAGNPASAVQVITGLGGQGKTGLVVEYAFRHAAAYDLVWWIRAEDQATMRGDYVELAEELGLPAEKDDQAIAALRRELRRRRNWLLIFDNAEDPGALFPLLPDRHSGHVLITARRRDWPHAETRDLDVLSVQAAAGYLQRTGQIADPGTARDLADALGCLPLALVQAASVIAEGMSAVGYLDLLRQQSSRLFAEGRAADRDQTIAATWRLSMDRLADRSPAAVALFRLSAFLAADAIPLGCLTAGALMPPELAEALADPLELHRATAALGEYSLAKTADGLLSIHRLVQAVTRSELHDEEPYWAGIALAAISAAFPGEETDPKTWPRFEEILAHALACTAHAVRLRIDTIATAQLLNRVALYLLVRGRLDSAASVVGQILVGAKDLDHDDPVYLSCQNTHGRLLLAQGDGAAAQAVHEEVYQARTRVLGPDDLETLRAGLDLVQVLHYQGQSVQAAQLHDRLVEAFTSVLGPDNLETITALAYLATLLRDSGQYVRARDIEERVVEVRIQALGDDHPNTLIALGNLAMTLREQGELSRARSIGEQVVEARTRVLGEDHPDTLHAQGNLATTLGEQGDLSSARSLQERIVEAQTRVLGEDHPDTLTARNNLAVTLDEQGELSRARSIGEQVVEARTRVQGEDHPDTLTAWGNLAVTLRQQGELDRARFIQERVLEARIRVLGEDHPATLTVWSNLALTLRQQREFDQASAIEGRLVETLKRTLGEEHPKSLAAMVDLSITLLAQRNEKEAISLLTEALEIALRVLGPKHTMTTETAWQLVQNCGPHEARRKQALTVRHLSWLGHEPPSHLTANQKKIKENLKGKKRPAPGKKRQATGKKKRK